MYALIALLLVSPGPDESKAVARFRAAFAADQATSESTEEKHAALAALPAYDSARVAKALIEAYGVLEREAEPIVEKRRPLLAARGGRPLVRFRNELEPVRRLQEALRDQLRGKRDP